MKKAVALIVVILLTFALLSSFAKGERGYNGHSKGDVEIQGYMTVAPLKSNHRRRSDPLMEVVVKGMGTALNLSLKSGTRIGSTSK